MSFFNNKNRIMKTFFLTLCVLFVLCIGFNAMAFLGKSNETKNAYAVTNANVEYASSSSFGNFKNGYVYKHTDPTKVDGFRAGTESSDVKLVTVNTSKTHGTEENPFVIANTADWTKFVNKCGTTGGSATEYFALANDIDFSSISNVAPVKKFLGNFYGLDHALKNVKIKSNWPISGEYGLFCNVGSTSANYITDLIIDNFDYNIPNIARGNDNSNGAQISAGGLIGYVTVNSFVNVLNVHVKGKFTYCDFGVKWIRSGGIAGYSNGTMTIYRCSGNVSSDGAINNNDKWYSTTGMVGQNNPGTTLKVYDSVGTIEAKSECMSNCCSAIGWAMGNTVIDNFVGSVKVLSSKTSIGSAVATFSGYDQSGRGPYVANNTFGYKYRKNGTETYYFSNQSYVDPAPTDSSKKVNLTVTNMNVVNGGTGAFRKTSTYELKTPNYDIKTHSSIYELTSSAKDFFGSESHSRIWDTSKIVENFGNYTPENSPVRNHLYVVIPEVVEVEYDAKEVNLLTKYKVADGSGIMTVTKLEASKNYTDVGEYLVHISLGNSIEAKFYTFKDEAETLREKDIKIVVKKSKIWVSGGVLPITETGDLQAGFSLDDTLFTGIYSRDLGSATTKPTFCLEYRKLSSSVWTKTKPTASGDYFARACITNEDSTNYELSGDGQVAFTVPKKNVAVPYFTNDGLDASNISGTITTVPYTGDFQTFKLVNSPDGLTLSGVVVTTRTSGISYNKLTGEFKVKAVGTYEVNVALEDSGVNTRWANYLNVSPERTITIVITKADLTTTIEDSSITSWQKGERDSIIAHVKGIKNSEAVSLTVECGIVGETLTEVGSDAIYPEDDNIHITINLATYATNQRYVLKISLKDDVSANKNYNLLTDNTSFEFFILTAVIKSVDVTWEYDNIITGNGIKVDTSTETKLPYNSKEYEMKLDKTSLPTGVKVTYQYKEYYAPTDNYDDVPGNVTAFSKSGKYRTVAILSAEDGYELSSSIVTNQILDWEITAQEFKISTLTFSDNPQWTGKRQSVYITNAPSGITVTNLSNSGVSVSNYLATFELDAGDNYSFATETDLPDGLTIVSNDGKSAIIKYNWEITEAVIAVSNSSKDWNFKTINETDSITGKAYTIAIPKVWDKYSDVLKLTYYDADNNEVADIYSISVTESDIDEYKCVVTLNEFSSGASNYIVKNINGSNEASYTFFVGGNKTPVTITFDNTEKVFFKNCDYKLNAKCDGYSAIAVTSTYYKFNSDTSTYETLPDGEYPKDVGLYKVIFSIQDSDYADSYTISNSFFEFEIKGLVLSTSGWDSAKKTDPLGEPNLNVYADCDVPKGCFEINYYEENDFDANFTSGTATKLTSPSSYNTNYVAVAVPTSDNVTFAGDAETIFRFRTGSDPDFVAPTSIPDPILAETSVEYDATGSKVSISNWSSALLDLVEIIDGGSLVQTSVGEYTVKFKIKDGVNAQWEWDSGSSTRQVTFNVVPKKLVKPKVADEIFYTGENIDVTNFFTGFDVDYMVITGETLKKDVGTIYKVTISLKDKTNTCWVEEDTTTNTNDITDIEWQILKATIKGTLNNSKGYPVLTLSNSEEADLMEIKYLNSAGEVVSESELTEGEKYRLEITLKDSNYQLNIDNSVIRQDKFIKEFVYKKPQDVLETIINFAKDNLIYICIGVGVLLLLIIIILIAKKRKKKDNTNDDMSKLKAELEKMELEKKLNELKLGASQSQVNGMNSQVQPNIIIPAGFMPQQMAMNSERDRKIDAELQELRDAVKLLAQYHTATPEEKKQDKKLASVEETLMQSILNNFADNPSWVPFNNQDMINYNIDDLMELYNKAKEIKAKRILSQLGGIKSSEQDLLNTEAKNFETKVAEYNKQKEDSKYEELLKAIREVSDAQKELKDSQQKLEEKVEDKLKSAEPQPEETSSSKTKPNKVEKLDFNEAFNLLPENQKRYFNELKDYALKQPSAKCKEAKQHISVGAGNSIYVKFIVKYSCLVAVFGTTEVKLENDNSIEIAKQMIDTRVKKFQEKI